MEIGSSNATPSQLDSNQLSSNESETDTSALASDFETFLKLLTTQLQNQDPSKPLDSTEFVAQLASFSSVEQQINMNTKLDQLIAEMSSGVTAELADWLGKDVKSEAPASFNGDPIDVFYEKPENATRSELVIRADDGLVVQRLPIDLSKNTIVWDGTDQSQNVVGNGQYSFSLENFDGNQYLDTTKPKTFSTVVETRLSDNGISLVFDDGSSIDASEVDAVRSGLTV